MLTTVQTALSKVVARVEPGGLGDSSIISSLVEALEYCADHYAKAHVFLYCNIETRLLWLFLTGLLACKVLNNFKYHP